jgi:acyl transferase domain-containing protein
MFDQASRYAAVATYQVARRDGSVVTAVRSPLPASRALRGWHRRAAEERLDLLAYHYLDDATKAWNLGWANGAVSLEALAAHDLVAIPRPS